ncbi:hypothetical protein QG37_00908 [Candidozyma auris]|nr:hypothetical protein QG37_00908 [[Candida] auris]
MALMAWRAKQCEGRKGAKSFKKNCKNEEDFLGGKLSYLYLLASVSFIPFSLL